MVCVKEVTVGYAGGTGAWPTYRNIQDYTEAIRVVFDPNLISYEAILHAAIAEMGGPPTRKNSHRQYRSAFLTHSPEQRAIALSVISSYEKKLKEGKVYVDVEDATDFYRGEEYHQKYYAKNRIN